MSYRALKVKGSLVPPPPKTLLPPPTNTPLSSPTKTDIPPVTGTPVTPFLARTSPTPTPPDKGKANDNTHLPRANADTPPLPEVPPKELPPPPPPKTTQISPASTPVLHPDNANTHIPRANADILPEAPPKKELPPPPAPNLKTTRTDLPFPTTDLPCANASISHPDNANIHTTRRQG